MIIDATRGSVARFVNRTYLPLSLSRSFQKYALTRYQDSCEPNCRMEKWIVDNKPRMALFAGENGVETGEELTYDYNFKYGSLFFFSPWVILTVHLL